MKTKPKVFQKEGRQSFPPDSLNPRPGGAFGHAALPDSVDKDRSQSASKGFLKKNQDQPAASKLPKKNPEPAPPAKIPEPASQTANLKSALSAAAASAGDPEAPAAQVPEKTFGMESYKGAAPSTLCLGCGHDQISKRIVQAMYEAQIDPFQIAKVSGIGCSSKTPNYFLKSAQGFNTIHGRMPAIAAGAKTANRNLKMLGVSGDGDTGSIGLGHFLHAIRRNAPMIYIVENNGVYGLTKGQFSATAAEGSPLKRRENNPFPSMDLPRLALAAGCGFAARSFSGDGKQLSGLLKLALKYEGFALIDVISPCIAYGNREDFPFSFPSVKRSKSPLHEMDIIEDRSPLSMDLKAGESHKIPLSDGSILLLRKLGEKEHDPKDKRKALDILAAGDQSGEIITGLIYFEPKPTLLDRLSLSEQPLVSMGEKEIRPSEKELEKLLEPFF